MRFESGVTRGFCLVVLLTLTMVLAAACGGDGEGEGGAEELSTEDRFASIEARLTSFEQYIALQAQNQAAQGQQVVVEIGEEGQEIVSTTAYIAPPLYSLRRADASENELEIVLWMADCGARTYLNPELPEEVIDWEIAKTESQMWEALENGQYSSFEEYIGQSFRFCRVEIVDEGDEE